MINSQALITSIKVKKLFGLYTYELPYKDLFSDAVILYGDNGVGKSTLLRLVFHLLSSANDRGHRRALYETIFDELILTLYSGYVLSAYRDVKTEELVLEIKKDSEQLACWKYKPKGRDRVEEIVDAAGDRFLLINGKLQPISKDPSKKDTFGEEGYLKLLRECSPKSFILNAERRLSGDTIPDADDEIEYRRFLRHEDRKELASLVERSREIALTQALARASHWVSSKVFEGANIGAISVHGVYVDILNRLIAKDNNKVTNKSESIDLARRISEVSSKTSDYSKYKLAQILDLGAFTDALQNTDVGTLDLVITLIEPYIESLESRLNAVKDLYEILHKFISIANSLLRDKSINFTPAYGFIIRNKLKEELKPSQLSSGEQQLLLLFCYILVARDSPSIFMIDEPEISLNIKWQRELIQSLLEITAGAQVQFIFASHSMELLSQHASRVVQLKDLS